MLSDDLITTIATGIESMPPKPASRRELQVLIARIEAQIRAAQERGCTYADIARQMTESGYPIKQSTLRVAFMRHRKRASQPLPSRRRARANAARPMSSTASTSA